MDKSKVETIHISKNDRFYFSRNYDQTTVLPLLAEARTLYSTIKELPVLPSLASKLEEEITRRSIHGTAAIEGNPLSEDEVGEILEGKDIIKNTNNSKTEIENLKTVYNIVATFPQETVSIEENVVLKIHSKLLENLIEPGKYRHESVKVGDKEHGGTYRPPNHTDVPLLMREFFSWINCEQSVREPQILRAAMAHYHLALIHPFQDGNGRTARLIEALILQTSGIRYAPKMLSNYYHQHVNDYYWAFSLSEKNKDKDITPFMEFFLKALIESLDVIKKRVIISIHLLAFKDFFRFLRYEQKLITRRQHDLLRLLLINNSPITARGLFQSPQYSILYRGKSERTARRDLAHLTKAGLLTKTGDEQYELNTRVLDNL